MTSLAYHIHDAATQHPTWGYKRLAKLIGCSPNAVRYHLDEDFRLKSIARHIRYRKINPLCRRLESFQEIREKKKSFDKVKKMTRSQGQKKRQSRFTTQELLAKLGSTPSCYLTGIPIDLDDLCSYEFDHIIPLGKGGDNTLDNLGLCIRDANRAKHDMTVGEFVALCRKVLEHQGFVVVKAGG